MPAGVKRRHEEEHKSASKRSRLSSSVIGGQSSSLDAPSPTLFTRICSFFRFPWPWLGSVWRSHHPRTDDTMSRRRSTHQSPRPTHSSNTHEVQPPFVIIIDDDDEESDNTGHASDRQSTSSVICGHSNHGNTGHGNHMNGNGLQGYHGKTRRGSQSSSKHSNGNSKVMERIAKEREDSAFHGLLSSYSRMNLSSADGSPPKLQQLTSLQVDSISSQSLNSPEAPVSPSYMPRLYSVNPPLLTPSTQDTHSSRLCTPDVLPLATRSHRRPSSGVPSSPKMTSPRDLYLHVQSPPHFTSVSPSPIFRTQPHSSTFRAPHTQPRSSASRVSHTQPRSSTNYLSHSNIPSYEDVPCDLTDFNHTSERPEFAPNNNKEAYPWLEDFVKHKFSSFADSKSRIEVYEKYLEINQQQRMEAENTRNKKRSERIHKLTINTWNPHLEEENELVLDLPAELSDKVDRIWRSGSLSEVFVERKNIRITRADLLTLRGLEWLNDEVINFYLTMVVDTVNTSSNRKVHLFNSFFYSKLMSNGYTGVRRWTKKVDIFSCDLILLPVHLGMHWCLASIDLQRKLIHYFDSLKGTNMKCLYALRDYLVSEARDKKQMEYDVSEFTLECRKDIPDQHNGSDCGVFTCMYARHLARDKEMNFSQEDLGHVRRMMVAEIVSNKLLFN